MAVDLIRYDLLMQEALRGVVRQVLTGAARDGLPGEHHFYIRFRTHANGVRLSARMRERYPDEMTIVLQHQFWDLSVTEQAFEVGLSFQNVPELLSIPFEAVTGFADPSVEFEMKFSIEEPVLEEPSSSKADMPPQTAFSGQASPQQIMASPSLGTAELKSDAQTEVPSSPDAAAERTQDNQKVVSIDAFRKKNS